MTKTVQIRYAKDFVNILKNLKLLNPDFFEEASEAIKQERFDEFCNDVAYGKLQLPVNLALETVSHIGQLSEENK